MDGPEPIRREGGVSPVPEVIVVRADDDALGGDRRITPDGFAEGVRRFLQGLGKKVLLANTVAAATSRSASVKGKCPTVATFLPRPRSRITSRALMATPSTSFTSISELSAAMPMVTSSG